MPGDTKPGDPPGIDRSGTSVTRRVHPPTWLFRPVDGKSESDSPDVFHWPVDNFLSAPNARHDRAGAQALPTQPATDRESIHRCPASFQFEARNLPAVLKEPVQS